MPYHQSYIAGHKFREGGIERLQAFAPGEALDLEPEPDNAHDPNAVKVLHKGFHVGYVPRDLAPEVCRLIASGRLASCNAVKGEGSRGISIHYREA